MIYAGDEFFDDEVTSGPSEDAPTPRPAPNAASTPSPAVDGDGCPDPSVPARALVSAPLIGPAGVFPPTPRQAPDPWYGEAAPTLSRLMDGDR